MPKHNSATLTCVSKAVHIITTTLYIQMDYTLFFSGQIGLSFGGKWAFSDTAVSVLGAHRAARTQHKDKCAKPSSVKPHICVPSASRG
ncbi:unnamed protein product [Staurois parvus]|uniref:Uncharacterized protein n=1 Tax=Staurois parvus TaxID=386267 RepID=A0ABN9BPK7_9NEOB|nr:unnamed protein product [Staurois parvus]